MTKQKFLSEALTILMRIEDTKKYYYFLNVLGHVYQIDIKVAPIKDYNENIYSADLYYDDDDGLSFRQERFPKEAKRILAELNKLHAKLTKPEEVKITK